MAEEERERDERPQERERERRDAKSDGGGGVKGFVSKKVGPLPLWGWAILAGGVLYFLAHRNASSSSSSTTGPGTGTGVGSTSQDTAGLSGAATGSTLQNLQDEIASLNTQVTAMRGAAAATANATTTTSPTPVIAPKAPPAPIQQAIPHVGAAPPVSVESFNHIVAAPGTQVSGVPQNNPSPLQATALANAAGGAGAGASAAQAQLQALQRTQTAVRQIMSLPVIPRYPRVTYVSAPRPAPAPAQAAPAVYSGTGTAARGRIAF